MYSSENEITNEDEESSEYDNEETLTIFLLNEPRSNHDASIRQTLRLQKGIKNYM